MLLFLAVAAALYPQVRGTALPAALQGQGGGDCGAGPSCAGAAAGPTRLARTAHPGRRQGQNGRLRAQGNQKITPRRVTTMYLPSVLFSSVVRATYFCNAVACIARFNPTPSSSFFKKICFVHARLGFPTNGWTTLLLKWWPGTTSGTCCGRAASSGSGRWRTWTRPPTAPGKRKKGASKREEGLTSVFSSLFLPLLSRVRSCSDGRCSSCMFCSI